MEYSEFLKEIKKVKGSRTFKVTNSFSIKKAYAWYRQHRPQGKKYVLNDCQFYAIVRKINDKLAEALVRGDEIKFPSRMGLLEIRKYYVEPKLDENGKLIYKAPVNWGATLKFWYECPEAREKKITIKVEKHDNYKIEYVKTKAVFKHRSYFLFQPNRALRQRVSKAASEGKLDAFEYNNYKNGSRTLR
jgi:hypothetical protein